MKLSDHFSLDELIFSDIAIRNNIDNTPSNDIIDNLKRLALLLENVRSLLNKPIRISSGYRCLDVNRILKSRDDSQHVLGCAADIKVDGMTPDDIVNRIINSTINYDQLIREYDSWVHISVPNIVGKAPRHNVLIIDKQGTRPYT